MKLDRYDKMRNPGDPKWQDRCKHCGHARLFHKGIQGRGACRAGVCICGRFKYARGKPIPADNAKNPSSRRGLGTSAEPSTKALELIGVDLEFLGEGVRKLVKVLGEIGELLRASINMDHIRGGARSTYRPRRRRRYEDDDDE